MPECRKLTLAAEAWEMRRPFVITGHTFTAANLLHATVSANGSTGQGEGAGVYYLGETGESMLAQAESVREAIESGAGRQELRELLPPGGARNALDCALWDLEAKERQKTIWELTGIDPKPAHSVFTIGIGTPEEMARTARAIDSRRLKLKLDDELPVERVAAVRAARPYSEIIVDVNQGWTIDQLDAVAPRLADLDVAMIEQPLPRGADEELEGFRSPVPLGADESCLCISEFEEAARRYQVINIKLDKTGGLTEALELAELAGRRGLELMVGNMMGTSLGMAPGLVVAQRCRFVDLDGSLFLKCDREHPMSYAGGIVSLPDRELWG